MGKQLFWSRDRLVKHKFDCLGLGLGLGLWIASGLSLGLGLGFRLGFMKNRKIPNVIFLGERIISKNLNGKRDLNRLSKSFGKNPTNQKLKDSYYESRRSYRKLIKPKKSAFIEDLCSDIERGKNINWSRFKRLKEMKTNGSKFYVFDMPNFNKFFKELYSKIVNHRSTF